MNKNMAIEYSFNNAKTISDSPTVKPLLKWAGGKSQLLNIILEHFPMGITDGKINKFAEPFIGGGALFFYILQKYPSIVDYFISDINEELILIYRTVQLEVNTLISALENIETQYKYLSYEDQKIYFYKMRSDLNLNKSKINYEIINEDWITRTATLMFLNKTCFNGLFRVNAKGEFNVPFGRYKNPKICDKENLLGASQLLQNVKITCDDFTSSHSFIDKATFVYFDPPYRPLSSTSSFTSYSNNIFDDGEQIRLANYYRELHKTGAKLLLSNSDPKNINPNDNFFDNLYRGFNIHRIDAKRMINCDSTKRGNIKELLINNYS